ncbi:unnamed protein product [Calypogeia fissa]
MSLRVLLVVLLTLAVGPAKYANAGDTDVKCIAKPPENKYPLDRGHVAALQTLIDSHSENDEVTAVFPAGAIVELQRLGTAVFQVRWARPSMLIDTPPKLTYKQLSYFLKLIVGECCPQQDGDRVKRRKDRSPSTAAKTQDSSSSSTQESTDEEFKTASYWKKKDAEKAKCEGGTVSTIVPVKYNVEFRLDYNVNPYGEGLTSSSESSSSGDLGGNSSPDDGPPRKRLKTKQGLTSSSESSSSSTSSSSSSSSSGDLRGNSSPDDGPPRKGPKTKQ